MHIKSLEYAKANMQILPFHDQTIWNCIMDSIALIDKRWCNYAFPVDCNKASYEDGIVHFVGSPKPWDLLGEFFHPYQSIWYESASAAGIRFPKSRRYFRRESWKRAVRIKNQYAQWLIKKD